MPADPVTIPECLWTRVCPNCGYSLEGVAAQGICPECGRTYDQSAVILNGYARGHHENISNTKGSRVIWVLFLSAAGILFQVFAWSLPGRFSVWTLVWAAVALAPLGFHLMRRWNSDHPGLIQVRLNSDGCIQCNNLDGPSAVGDMVTKYAWVVPALGVVALLAAYLVKGIGPIAFWIFFLIAMWFSIALWRSSRHLRLTMDKIGEGAIADFNVAFCARNLWTDMIRFELTRISGERHRFKVKMRVKFLAPSRYPIDAELNLTPDRAAALEELIQTWARRARVR